jgi:hypothetical protein
LLGFYNTKDKILNKVWNMLNLHSFFLGTFDRLETEVYSSFPNTVRGGSGPCKYNCGGKKFFNYHERAKVNPYTGETRKAMNHVKETVISKKVEKQVERIIVDPNMVVSLDYPSNLLEEVYKKSELYEATKIYEGPFYHEVNSFYNIPNEHEKSKKQKTEKKKVKKKNETKEDEQTEESDLTLDKTRLLLNFLLLSSMDLINKTNFYPQSK